MKRFNYRAKEKATGKIVKGNIQADSEHIAGQLLLEQGYIPETIVEEGAASFFDQYKNRVSNKEKITFTRQLATLINAGLPLSTSLRTVAAQTSGKGMKAVAEEIIASVESGKSLYDSFAAYPKIFDGVYLALIQAGEKSGTLDLALNRIADQEEKDASMLSKIRGAMVYPGIILLVIIAVLAFMMIAVVPQVRNLYEDMGQELPFLTQGLVSITDFFAQFGWIVMLLIIFAIIGVVFAVQNTKPARRVWDKFKISVPLFGQLIRKLYVSRFARTAEMMLATGVPMLDSITIAINATNNVVVEDEFKKALEGIRGGRALSDSLAGLNYMLPLVPQMAGIGEQSGKIDEMLGKAAQVYEGELDEQINNLSTMIEPILMVIMAALIGVVVGGTLLPIYSLVNSVSG